MIYPSSLCRPLHTSSSGYDQFVRRATYRERIAHFTEALDSLSETDKDWIVGRAIVMRLGRPGESRPTSCPTQSPGEIGANSLISSL